ncbi:class I SAM-dependent methyltransferase [Sporolactobacillus laevolacticus]|uniref:Methyltransferase type 11 domain-containing protein n=1 Tax=Sporolactobacillus laevolacticus DSM 442 TaxID=1395513 RepID=V6J5Q2_9BACL|nr:class I SAM-dependent methyltransferase [Sporolactobacillus laevolacticus]EST12079.1 hypothetical protein P343_08265 [Sporolactobacillus laevolacticus DSM 442]
MNQGKTCEDLWIASVLDAWRLLEKEDIPATLEGMAALRIQGCRINNDDPIRFSIQWDALEQFQERAKIYGATDIKRDLRQCSFIFNLNHYTIEVIGYLGTVVRTDPDRMLISLGKDTIAVKSIGSFMRGLDANDPVRSHIKEYLRTLQESDASQNEQAWNDEAYQAWINRFGTPEQAAEKIKRDPEGKLGALYPYLDDSRGQNVINLLGSHAGKALALALLGAKVTVVDISAENAEYAKNVAAALDLPLTYIISDVLQLPLDQHKEKYDIVFMELGILHYFIDLEPLADLVFALLKPGGRFVIQEFHPISTKLVTTRGKRQVVFGNYFDQSLRTRDVAYSKHLNSADEKLEKKETQKVYLREWTLGEIITAFAQSGLIVQSLEESPNMKISDIGLPKLFTLVCSKASQK